ncbi:MAG: UDP-N-acetylmuramoyl-tripeptide--D-alanyl-D-alanine ligase [Actinomycetota bacterium]|nr:UDP-N-acetylmuramoyl-tripeptide--D-alanyl-D-alanine ligase [Actinomycetota bacterium]
MIPLSLAEVARATDGRVAAGDARTLVHAVTTDSRHVPRDALFVALKGEHHDGHDYVAAARRAGAAGYLAERQLPAVSGAVVVADARRAVADLARVVRDRVDPVVVAITGSVGKTTTKDLVAAAVGAGRSTVAAPGSFNNELGVPLTCLAAEADTEVLVVEVGARAIGHVAALMPLVRPDLAIVTAIAGAHVETFGDLDAVAAAKGELVEALEPADAALLNADDARVVALSERTRARVVTFGRRGRVRVGGADVPVDVVAQVVDLDRLGRARFHVRSPWGPVDVSVPLAGEHQVSNALAALATAGLLGVDLEAAAAGIASARVSSWRSEVREVSGVVVLNDAYNANPASMQAALRTLVAVARSGGERSGISPPVQVCGPSRELSGRRRTWAVLGLMAELGPDSRGEHEAIGRYCVRLGVDRLLVVGEEAAPIAKGADLEGFFSEGVWQTTSTASALEILRAQVAPGDVVLVKGSRVAGLEAVAAGLLDALERHESSMPAGWPHEVAEEAR